MLLADYFSGTETPLDINVSGVVDSIASSRHLFDSYLGLPSCELTLEEARSLRPSVYTQMVARHPAPIWMKVHDAQCRLGDGGWLFPPEASGAIIYIVRNPLDIAVSLAFHDGHGDMAQSVAKLCAPDTVAGKASGLQIPQALGSWSDHVASWVDQDAIPVTVVRYEDMLANTARELTRILRAARPDIGIDEDRIQRAVKHAEFDRLAAAEAAGGFRERPATMKRFFRNGRMGDWRSHLSAPQVAEITSRHAGMMQRFGYEA